ncbi:MAG TPA: translesion DNA synthesis-associated protein ImuA, partial [Gammaproteobacteria bacterium]|nr:translesion DNA synthesis-associated protein ImuA [Gammaproteobacteria bacterium]
MNTNAPLDHLSQRPGICSHALLDANAPDHIATGFTGLDRLLPGGGWPLGGLTELYHAQSGIGELRLLMPALARLSRQGRWIALIAPPFVPSAAALASFGLDLSRVLLVHPKSQRDGLGALERGLRSGTCGAVLAWPKQIDQQALERLQQAAAVGRSWGVLFRDLACQAQSSPAALRLRLRLEACNGDTAIHLLQHCDGGTELILDLSRPTSHAPEPMVYTTPPPYPRSRPQPY